MDDCLSALDAFVSKKIVDNVLMGALKTKTIIMVSHHFDFISKVDNVILMKQGEIIQQGKHDAIKHSPDFRNYISDVVDSMQELRCSEFSSLANHDCVEKLIDEYPEVKINFANEEESNPRLIKKCDSFTNEELENVMDEINTSRDVKLKDDWQFQRQNSTELETARSQEEPID